MSSSAAGALPGFRKLAAPASVEGAVGPRDEPKPVSEPQLPTDEELMLGLRRGDLDALSGIYRRYARLVMAISLRVLRDRSEAEDLVQDVFVLLHRKRDLFDPAKGSARGWLIQVAYRQALNRREKLNARSFYTRESTDTPDTKIAELLTRTDDLGDTLYWGSKLEGVLELLTPDQKRTLQLYYFEGYTIEEISREIGHTAGNVRNHIYRGLERMRQTLASGTK